MTTDDTTGRILVRCHCTIGCTAHRWTSQVEAIELGLAPQPDLWLEGSADRVPPSSAMIAADPSRWAWLMGDGEA